MNSAVSNGLILTVVAFAISALAVREMQRRPAGAEARTPPGSFVAAPQAESRTALSNQEVLLARNNHFWADARIDGVWISAMVDTGASVVVLSSQDAARLQLHPLPSDRKVTFQTANGSVQASMKTLREIRLGNIVVRDVSAAILPPGALSTTLLGMSFMTKLRSYEVRGDQMIMRQ